MGIAIDEGFIGGVDDPITTFDPDQREVALEPATRVVDPPGREFQYSVAVAAGGVQPEPEARSTVGTSSC